MAGVGADPVPLREAVARWRAETGFINAFDWYRQSAHDWGHVSLGGTEIRAFKRGRSWFVDSGELAIALANYSSEVDRRHQMTKDLEQGLVHGQLGDVIHTDWGGYKIYGGFRFEWSDMARAQQLSDGSWYCNPCNQPARTEHDAEEYHRCRDWTPCGRDCRLSRVSCPGCGASLSTGFTR